MKKSVSKHTGSDFEDFLAEEGLLDDANAVAIKRVLAWQIQNEMKNQHINKTNMAKRMQTSRSSLDRLLDEHDTSLTLSTLTSAAQALGKKVKIELVEAV
ncbi:XRE family transcriptional regulator [Cellvibrio sp. pealriver]|uniref:XRE family transcriptional regulator n=1 Tax=Cellvibrio sp. pealriver TaxID=1622269 RepID=UPI00066FFD0E|nr:XRE family transcriptional regulator [Cellvibrio sp. pealriver]